MLCPGGHRHHSLDSADASCVHLSHGRPWSRLARNRSHVNMAVLYPPEPKIYQFREIRLGRMRACFMSSLPRATCNLGRRSAVTTSEKAIFRQPESSVCLVASLRPNGLPKRAAAPEITIKLTNIQLLLTHVLATARPADDAQ